MKNAKIFVEFLKQFLGELCIPKINFMHKKKFSFWHESPPLIGEEREYRMLILVLPRFYLLGHVHDFAYQALSYIKCEYGHAE